MTIINDLGYASAKAQGLKSVITTFQKLQSNPDQRVYILREERAMISNESDDCSMMYNSGGLAGYRDMVNSGKYFVVGFIKLGIKSLFMRDDTNRYLNIEPLCVLDFYINEECQRKGYGKRLFDYMLSIEFTIARKLAYDRPSEKLLEFLKKYYKLENYLQQNNNFVVFQEYGLNFMDLGVEPGLKQKKQRKTGSLAVKKPHNLEGISKKYSLLSDSKHLDSQSYTENVDQTANFDSVSRKNTLILNTNRPQTNSEPVKNTIKNDSVSRKNTLIPNTNRPQSKSQSVDHTSKIDGTRKSPLIQSRPQTNSERMDHSIKFGGISRKNDQILNSNNLDGDIQFFSESVNQPANIDAELNVWNEVPVEDETTTINDDTVEITNLEKISNNAKTPNNNEIKHNPARQGNNVDGTTTQSRNNMVQFPHGDTFGSAMEIFANSNLSNRNTSILRASHHNSESMKSALNHERADPMGISIYEPNDEAEEYFNKYLPKMQAKPTAESIQRIKVAIDPNYDKIDWTGKSANQTVYTNRFLMQAPLHANETERQNRIFNLIHNSETRNPVPELKPISRDMRPKYKFSQK